MADLKKNIRYRSTVHKSKISKKISETKSNEMLCGRQLSDTLLKLKEKITPNYRKPVEFSPSKTSRKSSKESNQKAVSAFDVWLKAKNEQLKAMQQRQKKKERESYRRISKDQKQEEKLSDFFSLLDLQSSERIVSGKSKYGREERKKIRVKGKYEEWGDIRTARFETEKERLRLGRVSGHALSDPPNLTKFVMKPDPAFQARYRSVIVEADSRAPQVILDKEYLDEENDPARLPARFRRILEAKLK